MVAFKWCCKRTRIVGFQCILLLLYCLLHSMQRLLSCSAWLFLLADAGQAAKLFQDQAIAEHKSSICSFIYNMQPHQPPCTYSDNARTVHAEQDSLLKVFWKTETHAAANFPKCAFSVPAPAVLSPGSALHSLGSPSAPSSSLQGKGAWAVAEPWPSVLHPGQRFALCSAS